MDRRKRIFNELLEDLREDCASFSNGNLRKAKDIAGRIRTLLKSGPNPRTISVLKQLDRDTIQFIDTSAPFNPGANISYFTVENGGLHNLGISAVYMGLVYKHGIWNDGVLNLRFAPFFERPSGKPLIKEIDFDSWWNTKIYHDQNKGLELTRKQLILEMTERDGFAHTDETLGEDYETFLEEDSLNLIDGNSKIVFANSPAKCSVRQIGYEVIATLENHMSDLIHC